MNRLKNLLSLFAFSLLILGVPAIASAQWGDNRDNDDYYRTGNYNRNLRATIKNLKNRSKEFAKKLDRELDHSRYDERQREDRLNHLAKDFARAADHLEDEYGGRRDYNNDYNEARQVLDLGSQLGNELYRARLSYSLQNYWNGISQDLRILADAYDNNYNRRNNRNDDYRRTRRNDDDYRRNRRGDDDDDYYNRDDRNRRRNRGNYRNFPFPFPFPF